MSHQYLKVGCLLIAVTSAALYAAQFSLDHGFEKFGVTWLIAAGLAILTTWVIYKLPNRNAPSTETLTGTFEIGSITTPTNDFRNPTKLTRWLKVLLWISIAVNVISGCSVLWEMSLLKDIQQGAYSSRGAALPDLSASDTVQVIVWAVGVVIFVILAVIFFCWIYRANYNAHQLGASGMRFTPAWSVGWYFIPIMNFWKPYEVMKEIWQASANPDRWRNQHPGEIVLSWWFFLVLTYIIGLPLLGYSFATLDNPPNLTADAISIIVTVSDICSNYVGIILVDQIFRMQMSRVSENGVR